MPHGLHGRSRFLDLAARSSARTEQERMRVVAFAFLTPFFFLKGGMSVSAGALWANLGVLAILFVAKMAPKFGGVYPLARRYTAPHATFTTLLMSTGLTFGTITSLYGLNEGIIDRTKFSLLIAVVVLSAIVPTAIAQRLYRGHFLRDHLLGSTADRLAEHAPCPVMIVR
jgi:Kef-type K+ transport system membrane component KefB